MAYSKYRNVKTNGYSSRKESKHATDLKLLQRAGLISDLREQVKYELIPNQKDKDGKVIERACSYIADFVYTENGNTVVVDTKGMRTTEYIIKRKLMLYVHGIRIKEV